MISAFWLLRSPVERMQLPKTGGLRIEPQGLCNENFLLRGTESEEGAMCPIYVGGEPRQRGFQKLREERL